MHVCLIPKTFANISKRILPSIISQQQSTFVLGSNISDNSIIVSEIANHLFKRRRGKNGLISFKMDMSKAYDRIEWMFLRRVMSKLGFPGVWINLIITMISSVSILLWLMVLISIMFFHPGVFDRELHSLLICSFSALKASRPFFMAKERVRLLHGISLGSGAPVAYELALGQKINLHKSEVCFSRNVKGQEKAILASILGIRLFLSMNVTWVSLPLCIEIGVFVLVI
ncbi:hypothetical protein FF1_030989 [Malus domestica]